MANRSHTNLIPIFYRVPFGRQAEIVSGYLEKKEMENGKRFYGHFRCENCGNTWQSGHTWQGYGQECRKCDVKNWPEKVYHLEQAIRAPDDKPHRQDLCEKCQKLGHNCQENHYGGSGYVSTNQFDQCFNKQFELLRYDIILEPRFIRDLFDTIWPDLDLSERKEFKESVITALGKWRVNGKKEQIEACEEILRIINNSGPTKPVTESIYSTHPLESIYSDSPLDDPPDISQRRFAGSRIALENSTFYTHDTPFRNSQNISRFNIQTIPPETFANTTAIRAPDDKPHRQDFCEKCQKLGHNCELLRFDIILEPQFIRDLFDTIWPFLDLSERKEFKEALLTALEKWRVNGTKELIEACEEILRIINNSGPTKPATESIYSTHPQESIYSDSPLDDTPDISQRRFPGSRIAFENVTQIGNTHEYTTDTHTGFAQENSAFYSHDTPYGNSQDIFTGNSEDLSRDNIQTIPPETFANTIAKSKENSAKKTQENPTKPPQNFSTESISTKPISESTAKSQGNSKKSSQEIPTKNKKDFPRKNSSENSTKCDKNVQPNSKPSPEIQTTKKSRKQNLKKRKNALPTQTENSLVIDPNNDSAELPYEDPVQFLSILTVVILAMLVFLLW